MQTEFVRSLNCNYERVLLDKKPEEKRYQYCILNRGGIRGLLPCSLRYINGIAYLYYDISSRQNIRQLCRARCIDRKWLADFLWGMKQIKQELERFLLDAGNLIWYPEQIYQDLESNVFSFIYIPYYEGDTGFKQLMDFWVEQLDYEDEALVECVYHMYEQYEKSGEAYLQSQIYEDAAGLEQREAVKEPERKDFVPEKRLTEPDMAAEPEPQREALQTESGEEGRQEKLLHWFGGKKKKEREQRENYRREMHELMSGRAVAEETRYGCADAELPRARRAGGENRQPEAEEEYGRTIYIEATEDNPERERRLCTKEGRTLAVLDRSVLTIGKRKGEADVVLEDVSVSRLHARILREKENYYIEDLNSTNGTFKNGLRLQPYEKRELAAEDEVKIGRISLLFV